ncbi:MAG: SpoIIIAH-like family protein [Clostridia bacterium]|nr:SpoIIIAH-like family protein [Clostridia bacterium]
MKRDKNLKSLEIFKKGFRKNEVVIYAIALMLVTAGYFNYTANVENSTMETYSEKSFNETSINNSLNESKNVENEAKDNTEKNIAKEKTKESIENTETIAKSTSNNEQKDNDESSKENNENKNENRDDEDIGDAKLVDSKGVVDNKSIENGKSDIDSRDTASEASDYFVSTKLQRDTNYADTISTYTKILEDGSVSETQKSIAMKEITKINDTKNAISICENLLSTKGFEHYVVLVNNDSINVVVKTEGGLTKQKVAQIQNIISREFKCEIENIHISEK